MGKVGRDVYRRKLEGNLARIEDEPTIGALAAIDAFQSGGPPPTHLLPDLPPEAYGAGLGSPYHFPPWTRETLVNELLATPKAKGFEAGGTRRLRYDRYAVFQMLVDILIKLENAEDGIFLERNDVFSEMPRIAQRQFEWQRGVANAPRLYRSLLLYGSGAAAEFFEANAGIPVAQFVKVGAFLSARFLPGRPIGRQVDFSDLGITPGVRDRAFARFAIEVADARQRAASIRKGARHTAYRPSILRDYPVIAFGGPGGTLRAPIADMVMYRYTTGLYLDVVRGGAGVWTEIGSRFERYVLDYLGAMMSPYQVGGEVTYGPKKSTSRTPDVLISDPSGTIVAAVESKAKRMTFEARFADDPIAEAETGFAEMAKGVFQLWRFFSHARRGLFAAKEAAPDCLGIVVTADSWLTMARNQERQVYDAAHALADAEGGIEPGDRRNVAICLIDDVEFVLQNGAADTFLAACRELSSGEKMGWMLSAAHVADRSEERAYPFVDRIGDLLPWWNPDR